VAVSSTSTSGEAPIPTETFDFSSFALCPKENPTLEFDAKKAIDFSKSNFTGQQEHEHFIKNVLGYLNSGGTPQSVIHGLSKHYGYNFDKRLHVQDITGDSVPELIYPYGIWIDVFGCQNGNYELIFTDTYESDLFGVYIIDITDINNDGLAESIVYFNGCMGNRCPIIRVYEWNGKDFKNLIADPFKTGDNCSSLSVAPFEVKIQDIDNNGTKEIILSNDGNPQPDNDFPYRKETRVCTWNGQKIVVDKTEFDAPYYRFQAVQDGDRATLSGDYGLALSFYQQTIDDKNLEWFTQERKWHDFWVYHSEFFSSEQTPTASPALTPDPNEYPTLSAYAYYRIMLLHVLQNDFLNAQSIFNKIQNEFPPESQGFYFAEVASIFWQEYQSSTSIENSCNQVVNYAQEHPLPAEYLGDWDHGVHSIHYTPEVICPFK
jgi:hypothetical protein